MSIGSGILLFVIGAILRFAVTVQLSWMDLPLVGNILMGAGVVVFILGLIFTFRKRRSTSTRRTVIEPADRDTIIRRTDQSNDSDI
jgi:membrane-bound ClpP family serine protease